MNFERWRHYARARLFELLGNDAAAIEGYRLALKHDPGFHAAAAALGYRCAATGRDDDAIAFLKEAVAIRPTDCDACYNLGFVLSRRDRLAEAIEAFRAAVALNARHDMAWYGLGLAHAALGDHRSAADAFERAAQLQPMGSPSWYQLGMACHHAQDAERVRQVIHHLNRFDPRMARRLIVDTGTTDLAHLVKDLVV